MADVNPEKPKPVIVSQSQASDIYSAELTVAGDEGTFSFRTQIPERFPIGLATTWDTPFNQPFSEALGGQYASRTEQLGRIVLGQSSLNKWMSGAVWTSGSVLEVSGIPFVLQARTDAKKEVLEPFQKLLRLVAPLEDSNGMLKPPGPHLLGENTKYGGEVITFRIGKFFTMSPCIVESVQGDFDTQFDSNGYPISATVSVTVKSFWSVTRQDIQDMFTL